MKKINILVVGASGQLGRCVKDVLDEHDNVTYTLVDHTTLDIGKADQVESCISKGNYDYVINCAAYTNVAGAEDNFDLAVLCNATGTQYLAESCLKNKAKLIHISTDYVFDGSAEVKTEESDTHPLNVYGTSKLLGEKILSQKAEDSDLEYMIIRTSWLYSEYGNNFVKTIINKLEANENMNIVVDQVGSPTYAGDLAKFIVEEVLLSDKEFVSGIYHYSNHGTISWYDFAIAICEIYNNILTNYRGYRYKIDYNVQPILSTSFNFKVIRPAVGILSKEKAMKVYNANIPYWKDSLIKPIEKIYKQIYYGK